MDTPRREDRGDPPVPLALPGVQIAYELLLITESPTEGEQESFIKHYD